MAATERFIHLGTVVSNDYLKRLFLLEKAHTQLDHPTSNSSLRSRVITRITKSFSKMSLRKVACFALVALLVVSCLVGPSEAGKLKKIAKLAILGKALAPKIIPIPLPIHFSKGHSYHHDPWAMGGGHGGGGGGGGGWW